MENQFAQLAPLVVFIPMLGLLLNMAFGRFVGERGAAAIGVGAALLALGVTFVQWIGLINTGYEAVVVDIPLLPSWILIPAGAVDIGWQFRVDTLSVTMMLVVTGVGTLIHFYAAGYMHGDKGFVRFFMYLNLFLFFMLILVTGNNFLMMFVGWEGVGLCSFLLIGFWYDKTKTPDLASEAEQYGTEGWRNTQAARKAFVVNRIGDFGLLMAIFLTFWTFGTLDFYKAGEVPIAPAHEAAVHEEVPVDAGVEAGAAAEGETAGETVGEAAAEGEAAATAEGEQAAATEGDHGEAAAEEHAAAPEIDPALPLSAQLGVFNQAVLMLEEGHDVDFGPFTLPIQDVITLITLFFLLGVTGKSAQLPLFVWLPDAMAGPTPVSALIHAATMVTAGVYLMVRSNVLFYNAPVTSLIVTLVGAGTAAVGGVIALGQWDIKKVLAYSTISQLGFMVAAVGIGAYAAAMFHLVTHAFFKALLFLGSGVIIHAMEHADHHHSHEHIDPQDMRNMGGLRKTMPRTYRAYLIGALALAGIFPLAGFWSKDEILADSLVVGFVDGKIEGYIAFIVLLGAAVLTAFYIWRQIVMVFHGTPRTQAAIYTNEEDYGMPAMVRVLMALAAGAVVIGFINIPSGTWVLDPLLPLHGFTDFLQHSVVNAHAGSFQWMLAVIAVAAAVVAMIIAGRIYGSSGRPVVYEEDQKPQEGRDPLQLDPQTAGPFELANQGLYYNQMTYDAAFYEPRAAMPDEAALPEDTPRPGSYWRLGRWLAERLDWAFWHDFFHNRLLRDPFNAMTRILTTPVDLGLIDGVVNGVGRVALWISSRLRNVQTGYVRSYAVSVLLGALLVILLLLWPIIQTLLNGS